jgi:Cu-Zn family superoxide dismutase
MRPTRSALAFALLALPVTPVPAQEAAAEMHAVSPDAIGEAIGTVQFSEGDGGLTLAIDVRGLAPGGHGMHLHENGSCEPAANDEGEVAAARAAGGHYDPESTGAHAGPEIQGHKGDLPLLEVGSDGTAVTELTAPRLTLADARGKALIIHAGGDNYSDQPEPLGGGGDRVACGVVQ